MKIELYHGSILDIHADVIVNPANNFLQHGGGLARIIHDIAAGLDDHGYDYYPWPLQEERARLKAYEDFVEEYNRVPTGDCLIGPPGLLNYKAIAHTVGPIWKDGSLKEGDLLYLAYMNTLNRVYGGEEGFTSVVFPAISAGIFGAPIEEVVTAAIRAISAWHNHPTGGTDHLSVAIAVPEDHYYKVFEDRFKSVDFIR